LQISYIGMQTQEVAIKPNLKVVLKPDTEVLDEVVVTGYGTFKKSSFTGSASNVTTEKLQDLPSISVQDRLAGSVAGVQITSTSGQLCVFAVWGLSMPAMNHYMSLTECPC